MSAVDTQDLIEDILVDEAEKEALREELAIFLEEFRQKKNDEGKPLVQFPKNFDQISDAMTRQDIISTDDKTWSKYLLEEKFNQDSKKRFEGGRYRDLLSETEADARVHRGLAEIHMLDKQICNLNKQANRLPGSTPRDRGRKRESQEESRTFITGTESTHGGDSTLNTARSTATSCSETQEVVNPESSTRRLYTELDEDTEPMSTDEATMPAHHRDNMSEKQRNIELRLEALLRVNDNGDDEEGDSVNVLKTLSRYGYTEESQDRIRKIDQELSEMQSKLFATAPDSSDQSSKMMQSLCGEDVGASLLTAATLPPLPGHLPSVQNDSHDTPATKEKKENILQKQRETRLMKKYEKKIDEMIHQLHNEELNISGLVDESLDCPRPPSVFPPIETPTSQSGGGSPKTFAITNSPRLEASIADRKITMMHVHEVIEELCYSGHNNCREVESAKSSTAEQRVKLERLLSSIRPDVTRLADERVKVRGDSLNIVARGRFDFHDRHSADQRGMELDDSSYNSCLQDYLEEFTIEQEKSSNIDVMQLTLEGNETNLEGIARATAGRITTDSASSHENVWSNGGISQSGASFVSEHGALSRMTTLELKKANKKKIAPTEIVVNDGARVQNIILDIMAKRNSSHDSGRISDESEIVINLDHVHDKIQTILNRAQSARNDNNDDCITANNVMCEDESSGLDCGVDLVLDES